MGTGVVPNHSGLVVGGPSVWLQPHKRSRASTACYWSPDSQLIASVCAEPPSVLQVFDRTLTTIEASWPLGRRIRHVEWDPKSERICCILDGARKVVVVYMDHPELRVELEEPTSCLGIYSAFWSPDGTHVVTVSGTPDSRGGGMFGASARIWPVDTESKRTAPFVVTHVKHCNRRGDGYSFNPDNPHHIAILTSRKGQDAIEIHKYTHAAHLLPREEECLGGAAEGCLLTLPVPAPLASVDDFRWVLEDPTRERPGGNVLVAWGPAAMDSGKFAVVSTNLRGEVLRSRLVDADVDQVCPNPRGTAMLLSTDKNPTPILFNFRTFSVSDFGRPPRRNGARGAADAPASCFAIHSNEPQAADATVNILADDADDSIAGGSSSTASFVAANRSSFQMPPLPPDGFAGSSSSSKHWHWSPSGTQVAVLGAYTRYVCLCIYADGGGMRGSSVATHRHALLLICWLCSAAQCFSILLVMVSSVVSPATHDSISLPLFLFELPLLPWWHPSTSFSFSVSFFLCFIPSCQVGLTSGSK
eukprot:GHVU01036590.1.p1 GENE.GHVU01036590.1~~GHVU01036590.1.p1  ORF type:complete len:531 (+),score=70.18 GHVU01036590.1:720-2312(+)